MAITGEAGESPATRELVLSRRNVPEATSACTSYWNSLLDFDYQENSIHRSPGPGPRIPGIPAERNVCNVSRIHGPAEKVMESPVKVTQGSSEVTNGCFCQFDVLGRTTFFALDEDDYLVGK